MKTISVKEAAKYLGITPRAVTYRLERGQLKGHMSTNEFGSPEWRIYPNSEIVDAMQRQYRADVLEQDSHATADAQESIDVETEDESVKQQTESPWVETKSKASEMADEFWRQMEEKFLRTMAEQNQLIGALRQELTEKEQQLKLLPDLQSKAEADRRTAQAKATEVRDLEGKVSVLEELMVNVQKKLDEHRVKALELQEEKRRVESEKETINEELTRLQQEKEERERLLEAQLSQVQKHVDVLRRPWWKKFFLPAPADE